ncbi:uncharacterized protein LOC117600466 [Osmia lignaria lignaria]|uniref:uncharacterized protein LOC117600466 n=1 Tax=Osmia lignaria lignaria TaxID=1437193 RepID=UPI001479089D|nr:uncharacterized protein LOC117600466 [Osmia lignaria]
MKSRVCSVLISFCLHLVFQRSDGATEERFPVAKGFLAYRTVSTFQKYCTCPTSYSCSCCQSVFILYTQSQKNLCVNFTYQRNGLNIDVTLNSDTIKARTVTNYKPLKFCTNIPGCYFSSACVNILELNKFPRSITACLRLDISSKKRLWQLNYDCISISTELPMMPSNSTISMTNATTAMPTTTTVGMTTTMSSIQMTMTTTMMSMKTVAETEETTVPGDVEVIPTTEIMDID